MFGLLIAGCGNRTSQSSIDEILDDITQNLNAEKINNTLDSILCRCSEEAKLRYYQNYHHRPFNLAIADYDDEFIVDADKTNEQLKTAEELIELVDKYIDEN